MVIMGLGKSCTISGKWARRALLGYARPIDVSCLARNISRVGRSGPTPSRAAIHTFSRADRVEQDEEQAPSPTVLAAPAATSAGACVDDVANRNPAGGDHDGPAPQRRIFARQRSVGSGGRKPVHIRLPATTLLPGPSEGGAAGGGAHGASASATHPVLAEYERVAQSFQSFQKDCDQQAVLTLLCRIHDEVVGARRTDAGAEIKGLYLHGGCGRGKTALSDVLWRAMKEDMTVVSMFLKIKL